MNFISYAQNLEDVILWKALKNIKNGFYIDVGANDPVKDSVTKTFYEYGWHGINIEPEEEFFDLLTKDRKRDINLNLAVSNKQEDIEFYTLDTRGWSTSEKNVAERHRAEGHKYQTKTVKSKSLDEICEDYDINDVHFLKIDVEGGEKDVLESFSFKKVRPWIVIIEATQPNTNIDISQEWEYILLDLDYIFSYFDGINKYYTSKEHSELSEILKVPPTVLDDFISIREVISQRKANRAETRVNEIKHKYHLIVNSTSWKITKPLRVTKNIVRWVFKRVISWLTLASGSRPRRIIKSSLIKIKYKLNPKLKSIILKLISRFPGFKKRLILFTASHKHMGQDTTSPIAKQEYRLLTDIVNTNLDKHGCENIVFKLPDNLQDFFSNSPDKKLLSTKSNSNKKNIYIDISNYYTTRAHTGIQRVIREFLFRLISNKTKLNYKMIYYERDLQKFIEVDNKEVLNFLHDSEKYSFENTSNTLPIEDIKNGDIFFDLDAVWNNILKRNHLYKILKTNNAKIFTFIYDLIPIIKPQFANKGNIKSFTAFIYATYQYCDLVFFDSRSTEKDFFDTKSAIKNTRDISTRVVMLGSDIHLKSKKKTVHQYSNIITSKYILFVGTLEPRKNHSLVLSVFEKIEKDYNDLHLVFVGKEGWSNSELINRIKKHPLLNKKFHWLDQVNDEDLSTLYENAYICTYLSDHEGFGLPIAESLGYGNITITSKNSSMYEVAKNYADYLIYNSFNELYETITYYLDNSELYIQKKEFIQKGYKPYSWDITYTSIINVVNNYTANETVDIPEKIQFVFISIDLSNISGTILALDKYIDFINSYLIITNETLVPEFQKIKSEHDIKIINENEILDKNIADFRKQDQQTKNWMLRASLLKIDTLQAQFIMLDDNSRPIREIPIEHFINNGKYNAYYYYNLLEWHNYTSDYDFSQHHTKEILDKDGFELLSYSSHKPQIIDKDIFREVVEYYFQMEIKESIDIWSIYFNYAISKYPQLFIKNKFDVLNWPVQPSNNKGLYTPDLYNFEDFHGHIYKEGIFRDIDNLSYDQKMTIKKNELDPYTHTKKLMNDLYHHYQKDNTIYGVLEFRQNDMSLFCYGLPYYLEASKGSWLKIPINYKALSMKSVKELQIMYYINGQKGHFTNLYSENNEYFENIVDFDISCISLQEGIFDLLVDIVIDSKSVYGDKSPYRIKLHVK